jgi:hypothetical protein
MHYYKDTHGHVLQECKKIITVPLVVYFPFAL